MTNAERVEALEAQVAKLTQALLLADPVAAAVLLSSDDASPAEEADAEPVEG